MIFIEYLTTKTWYISVKRSVLFRRDFTNTNFFEVEPKPKKVCVRKYLLAYFVCGEPSKAASIFMELRKFSSDTTHTMYRYLAMWTWRYMCISINNFLWKLMFVLPDLLLDFYFLYAHLLPYKRDDVSNINAIRYYLNTIHVHYYIEHRYNHLAFPFNTINIIIKGTLLFDWSNTSFWYNAYLLIAEVVLWILI